VPDILKDIPELHYTHCPLCGQERLTIVKGKPTFLGLGKEPDEIHCTNCETSYETDDGQIYIRFREIPEPYLFFADSLSGWHDLAHAAQLGMWIRTNDPKALDYLDGAAQYAWRVRLLLGSTAPMYRDSVKYNVKLPPLGSIDETKERLHQAEHMQAELRQVKHEIEQTMRELELDFRTGVKDPKMQGETLFPYEHLDVGIDDVLIHLDGVKLEAENWLETQQPPGT
jgi:transcription elongation factor Elf1